MTSRTKKNPKLKLGWREWASLPKLGVPVIRAKIDTGARTSALHADDIRIVKRKKTGGRKAYFTVETYVKPSKKIGYKVRCSAKVTDQRFVTDSGGHRENRWVIETPIQIGEKVWPIEITLTRREGMRFPMLLGRQALGLNCLIAPRKSFVTGDDLLEKWMKHQRKRKKKKKKVTRGES